MSSPAKDARAFSAVKLGDGQPLVPPDTKAHGPAAIVAAALKRLTAMRRPRAPVLYHRVPSTATEREPRP